MKFLTVNMLPSWCIHDKIATVLSISRDISSRINRLIDSDKNSAHDSRHQPIGLLYKIYKVLRTSNKLREHLMAFHLHQILDIVVDKNKSLEQAIEEYESLLKELENLCLDETQEALTKAAEAFEILGKAIDSDIDFGGYYPSKKSNLKKDVKEFLDCFWRYKGLIKSTLRDVTNKMMQHRKRIIQILQSKQCH